MASKKRSTSRSDVAKLAGVSPSTVSLVLNNTPNTRIREDTRERVFAAAEKIGYRPSSVARALVTGKTNIICVMIFFQESPFEDYSASLLSAAWPILNAKGFRMSLEAIPEKGDASMVYREHAADGALLIAPPPEIRNLEVMVKGGFPMVAIGSRPQSFEMDYVDIDNFQTGYDSTEFLLNCGHRDILHISGPTDEVSSAQDRLKGYLQALKDKGITPKDNLIVRGDYLYESGREALAGVLKRKTKFSAVFAANDSMAYAAIDLLHERGIDVPNDVSVVGVNTLVPRCNSLKMLTAIQQPLSDIGAMAAEMILNKINGKSKKPKVKLFKGKFVKGLSVIPFLK